MSVLHLLRSSAFEKNDFKQCLKNLNPDDNLVLMDDGCYNLHHPLINEARAILAQAHIHMVKTHAQARAVNVVQDITLITLDDIISLTLSNDTVVTWQ